MVPIRVVFTRDGERVREKLWTAFGAHWISADGPFPYDACEEWHIKDVGPASIISAIPFRKADGWYGLAETLICKRIK